MCSGKTYTGRWDKDGHAVVTVDGRALSPRPSLKICNHSPDGFNWGYGGSGPAQLALALLLDASRRPLLSQRFHQAFKWDYVAKWGGKKPWKICECEIMEWLGTALSTITEEESLALFLEHGPQNGRAL